MPKLTLEEWATDQFRTPPSASTLRAWIKDGRIHPRPVKHGRRWYVEAVASYVEPDPQERIPLGGSLISRIARARNGSKAA
ncbi:MULTISPECIES: excisionase [Pseudomonas]|uniref:excisionase n=1 Tax=Pseudomonas TaxID=286 RepID=UPI0009EA989B|nr:MULTISPECIES: excisionase [Pseudomonas]